MTDSTVASPADLARLRQHFTSGAQVSSVPALAPASSEQPGSSAAGRRTRALCNHAYLGRFRTQSDRLAGRGEPDCFDQLASIADPENWDGIGAGDVASLRILRNYIEFTFEKLAAQDKVVVSDNRQFCAFNTGLATPYQETIYGVFTPNRNLGQQPWYFHSWREESSPILLGHFPELPEHAEYTGDPADLVYDWRRELVVNVRHILSAQENLSRFPEMLRANPYAAELAFAGALERAKRRVRRNYRAAVPFWYPTQDQVQLLLPLSLLAPDSVDLALVVSRQGEHYRGHTVLTMAMAYNNARLLTRPDSDWLDPVPPADDVPPAELAAS